MVLLAQLIYSTITILCIYVFHLYEHDSIPTCIVLCIYVFYLYEHDSIPTCIAFKDSPVKRPEDDQYVGRNM
jgi:hypothetical protein